MGTILFRTLLFVCVVLFAGASCGPATTTIDPTKSVVPEPKPADTSNKLQGPPPEYFVVGADTIAIGTVAQGSTPAGQTSSVYSYWDFNVEEYPVKPLPEKTIKIKIWESDGPMPVKGPRLRTGEHLLVFLQKEGDSFVFVGGVGQPGKFTVQDGRIQYSFYSGSPWEPLDSAVARIKVVAETWAGESLTPERREQVTAIALNDPSVHEFLLDREYEVAHMAPYLLNVTNDIRYLVEILSPNHEHWEAEFGVIVNVTTKTVDQLNFNLGDTELSESENSEAFRIALAEPAVRQLLKDRGSETLGISKDFWKEEVNGKTIFHVFPRVELMLYPRGSGSLDIFVDLKQNKVVKLLTGSLLSPNPTESSVTYRDFVLTVRIPRTEYTVGENATAMMTLTYQGDGLAQISSPGGEYFDLQIKDSANTVLYRWRDEKYGGTASGSASPGVRAGTPSLPSYPPTPPPEPVPPPFMPSASPLLPPVVQFISPGWSFTGTLQFRVPQEGILYLMGYTFHSPDGSQVIVQYPDGHGEGVNTDAPFLVIQAH